MPTYFYALTDCWDGLECAVHQDRDPAPFARWKRVSEEEYRELRREGFRVRRGGKETTKPERR